MFWSELVLPTQTGAASAGGSLLHRLAFRVANSTSISAGVNNTVVQTKGARAAGLQQCRQFVELR